jgi:excisionase family DNA binding protein
VSNLETDVLNELARRVAALLDGRRDASPWMSAPEAAEYLRYPLKRVYNLTAANAIPHHRQGGRLVFHRDELDNWLEGFYSGPVRLAS